ncbi:ABC transporter permease subunit [Halorarum halobium]|uniref:ABC transporter permease subunit n=1 Tax=Halorarum halobium TaxID=3075121 RepID=UPI0028B10338|nr:ABC transporter permease subunit [Halobaculum sp. XH14]
MSVATLARKDVRDASRSRTVWALTAVFTAFALLGVSLLAVVGAGGATALQAVGALTLPSVLLVPLAAIVVGYVAVVGESRDGSLKLLLGFPVSRAAVLAGKLLGRTAVVAGSIAVAFAVAGVLGVALYGGFSAVRYAAFTLATVGLGVAFVGFAVGVSAAVDTRGKALAAAAGAYFLLVLFWQPLVAGIYYVAAGDLPGATVPSWYLFLERLSPTMAYQVLVEATLGVGASASIFSLRPPGAATAPLAEQLGTDAVPAFLSPPVAVVVLGLWTVVPTLLGYLRFRRRDL